MHASGSQAGRRRPASRPCRPDGFFVALSGAADYPMLGIAVGVPGFGGPLRPGVPASDPDERPLGIFAIEDVPPSRMLLAALPVLLRSGRPVPGITLRHAACADEPPAVTPDGESVGTLPGSFEAAGKALRVIAPLSLADKEDDLVEGGAE